MGFKYCFRKFVVSSITSGKSCTEFYIIYRMKYGRHEQWLYEDQS